MNRCVLVCIISQLAVGTARADETDYLAHVKPIFRAHCFRCHGALKQEAGLRLDTAKLARRGGDSGPAVIPGSADKSPLLRKVLHADPEQRMPPEGKPLRPAEIDHLRAWIQSGAKAPADERPEADPAEHWSFRPLRRPPVPRPANSAWVRNPIDAFIAAEHQARGLVPLPPADKRVLLRRLYLDLLGLPPTRSELKAFVDDPSADAYERVVDRLLSSSRYGERWARHWMDIWRYSDWYGRRQVNDVRNSYPHIWRWRDWIVDGLNADKGYDQMVREMLAADEMYPEDDSRTVALGFIVRNWFSLNYDTWKQDLVEHTGKAFLGLRLNCAHCHDHKYDPISQEEYFAFRAFFEPLEFRHDRVPGGPRLTKYMRYKPGSGASLRPIEAGLARIYDAYVDEQTLMYRLGDTRDKTDRAIAPYAPAILGGDQLRIEPVKLPAVAWYPELKSFAVESELNSRAAAVAAAEKERNRCRSALPAVSKQVAQASTDLATAKRDVPDDPKRRIRKPADVIAEWRFEGKQDSEFLADSRGGPALRRVTESDPAARVFEFLSTAGVKSFPNPLPLTGVNNHFAAEFRQDRSFAYLAAETDDKFSTNTFTLEAFIHCHVSQRNFNRTIAALDGCWTLLHRGLDAETFELRLLLQGANGRLRDVSTAQSPEIPASQRMRLKTGHDYYVCVCVGQQELLFCAANLTANTALHSCSVSRGSKQVEVFDLASPENNALFRIGNSDGTGRFHGLIDEVRYTRGQLRLSQIAAACGRSTDDGIQHAQARLAQLERSQRNLQLDLLAAEQNLQAASKEWKAYQARVAAARAEFVSPSGDISELASTAARREWEARQAAAIAKRSQAEQQLRRLTDAEKPDAKKIKQANEKLAAAAKSADQAAKSTWDAKSKYTPLGPQYPRTSSGRRTALASWIASDDNPLTARVAVNHIWMRHFGRPLVDSVFDFGRGGQRPTQPALLDWMAMELMSPAAGSHAADSSRQAGQRNRKGRWSMKALHRLIVTSSTYRLSSGRAGESQGQERIDKENVYRWKSDRRRLESEGVRDCMLFVSGQLDSRFGGIDLDPAREWETRRRSLYYTIYPESGGMMQFLTLFDAPDPCDCYRRTETTVPQQALALSNSRLALILGRQLAARLAVETRQGTRVGDDETFIIALFETVLSRGPRPSELGFCREFLQRQEQLTRDLPEAELKSPAEKGVVPGSTNPRQRARESLVRVLLNHNEFITIQ